MNTDAPQHAVETIQARNARVEADKAWETSWTRRVLITLATYCVICLYLMTLGIEKFWMHALVPAIGYFLSTLSLPVFKTLWMNKIYKVKEVS